MAKRMSLQYIVCIMMVCFAACKKNPDVGKSPVAPEIPAPTTPVPVDPKPTEPIVYSKVYELGTGSGNLPINGSSLTLNGNVLIKIKGGSYQSIQISNINNTTGIVMIQNDGLVQLNNGQMRLSNLNNVTISGNGTAGIDKGFVFKDNAYRPVEVEGTLNNFTFQYASFKNIGDYVFTYKYDKLYDGSEDSYSKNLKFLHIDCDNTRQFLAGSGSSDGGVIKGVIKNLEIAYINFQNSPDVGTIVWFGNVENYDVHHNVVNNINTTNNNHNGIFLMNGNGKFHHNKISNHQGNAIRAFSFTLGSTPKEVLIYDNIVINSRKYSAFEVQAFTVAMSPGKTTYVNARVFNNTCGNLNLSNDWQGNLVDVYGLEGGSCTVFNNVAFNLPAPYNIAGQVSGLVPISTNNMYFKTSKEAGIIDEQNFRLEANSPLKGKGVKDPLLQDDYYGTLRSSTPSIGAVE